MPPKESSAAEFHNHRLLAKVIEDVLRRRSGRITVRELAKIAGFSRFHLTRLFHYAANETLESFLRRVRLERAAYTLIHSDKRIFQVASESGYRSPEAFCRAFQRAFGCLPTQAKDRLDSWELSSPVDLHWLAEWVVDEDSVDLQEQIVMMPPRYSCVRRVVGDYADLATAWGRLQDAVGPDLPESGTFITIYRDNLWSHPVCRTLSADIGWICEPGDQAPRGMRRCILPGSKYATTRFVDRSERTMAWLRMLGRYVDSWPDQPLGICYDQYSGWPLPFDEVKTRLFVSLSGEQRVGGVGQHPGAVGAKDLYIQP